MDDVTFSRSERDAERWRLHSAMTINDVAMLGRSLMSMNACYYSAATRTFATVCRFPFCAVFNQQRLKRFGSILTSVDRLCVLQRDILSDAHQLLHRILCRSRCVQHSWLPGVHTQHARGQSCWQRSVALLADVFHCLVHTADTDKTRLSCLVRVSGVYWVGDKTRQFSVVLNIFETEQLQIVTGSRQDKTQNCSNYNMFTFEVFCLRQSWLVANSVHTADTDKTRQDSQNCATNKDNRIILVGGVVDLKFFTMCRMVTIHGRVLNFGNLTYFTGSLGYQTLFVNFLTSCKIWGSDRPNATVNFCIFGLGPACDIPFAEDRPTNWDIRRVKIKNVTAANVIM